MNKNKKHVVLSLSGGMDSSTLLLRCLEQYDTVTAVSFDYGQKHKVELEKASSLALYIAQCFPGIEMNFTHKTIDLSDLGKLLDSNLVNGGEDVPEGHYEQENMKKTVVPNRNKIFSSIVQAIALSKVKETGEFTDIALGIHSGDHAIYPDCRQEFRDADDNAFRIGNWDVDKVGYYTPYLEGDKLSILKDGTMLCERMGLSFDEVYKRTNTSYKPIYLEYPMGSTMEDMRTGPEGEWYSDYKSASSVERIEAFINLGRPDPVQYADETGKVSWETARDYVKQVLQDYKK